MANTYPTHTGLFLFSEDDSVQTPDATTGVRRLLIIQSRKGAVNKLVQIEDWNQYKRNFDDISASDHRKGNFSAISAYWALQQSPILVLNLRSFDDLVDVMGSVSLSTATGFDNLAVDNTTPIMEAFSKRGFWELDPERLQDSDNDSQLLKFANVSNGKRSIFVRKTQSSSVSQLTFRSWYNSLGRNIPDFVDPDDYVRDYYVDVFVFGNDFSSGEQNSSNSSYGYLFSEDGVLKTVTNELGNEVDGLGLLATIPESGFLSAYTGCMIPQFIDESGTVSDIVTLINSDVNTLGLVSTLNIDILDEAAEWFPVNDDPTTSDYYFSNNAKKAIPVDFVGHGLCNITAGGAFDETNYEQADLLGDNSVVQQISYSYPLLVNTIRQSSKPTLTDFVDSIGLDSGVKSLDKITNIMLPAIEEANGTDFDYTVDVSEAPVGSVAYLFESTKAVAGDKFVSRDGNLATVTSSSFVGSMPFLSGVGTSENPVQPVTSGTFDNGLQGYTNAISMDWAGNGDFVLFVPHVRKYFNPTATTDAVTLLSGGASVGETVLGVVDASVFVVGDYVLFNFPIRQFGTIIDITGNDITLDTAVTANMGNVGVYRGSDFVEGDYFAITNGIASAVIVDANNSQNAGLTVDVTTAEAFTFSQSGTDVQVIALGTVASLTESFSYTDEYTVFPQDVNDLYIYPVGHPLSGEVLVYDTDGFIVHNPPRSIATDSSGYVLQELNGVPQVPTFSDIYLRGVEDILPEISASDLETNNETLYDALLLSSGTSENVYKVSFNKPIALNDANIVDTIGTTTPYTEVGQRSVDSVIVLDDGSELVVFSNDLAGFKVYDSHTVSEQYTPITLTNYTPRRTQFLDGTAARQKEVLDVLLQSGIRSALKDLDALDIEYIVDCFKSYIEPSIKVQLTTIAKDREACLAICNLPFARDMERSKNPYFSATIGGEFDPTYMVSGGNLSLPNTNSLSLPTNGATYSTFSTNVILDNSGDVKPCVAAALVSNNYVAKENAYDPVLGSATGTISGVGVVKVEYPYSSDQLATLEPWGMNAIVKKKNTGLQILGNRTAQNTINSQLSYVTTREIVKHVQLNALRILEPFIGLYNTDANRLSAKTQMDNVLSPLVNAGAISPLSRNVVDTTNNTGEVIRSGQFIFDTYIIANTPSQAIIHRTTLTNDVDGQSNVSFEIL